MKRTVKLGLCCAAMAAALGAAAVELPPYRPMVVEGNTWKYFEYYDEWKRDKPNHEWMLRIEGDTVINNIEYKKLNAYTDSTIIPDAGMAYAFLREDCEHRKVYGFVNNNYPLWEIKDRPFGCSHMRTENNEEFLIYDFINVEKHEESVVDIDGVEHRKLILGHIYGVEVSLIEGIGRITPYPADLICVDPGVAGPNQRYSPYLYSFVNSDGKETFTVREHIPANFVEFGEPYSPIAVEGRSWKYVMRETSKTANDDKGFQWNLKVGGDTVVNGLTYKKLHVYVNGAEIPDQSEPYGFLRDDVSTHRVYGIYNTKYVRSPHHAPGKGAASECAANGGREVLLYDFIFPQYDIFNSGVKSFDDAGFLDESHKYYYRVIYGYRYVEGLGGLGAMAESQAGCGDLLDHPALTGDGNIAPYLYAVTDAGGNEIFTIEENRPMGGVETVGADEAAGEPVYFNLQGVRVEKPAEGHLYIVRRGDRVSKQLYR